jgi:hypothetical protein
LTTIEELTVLVDADAVPPGTAGLPLSSRVTVKVYVVAVVTLWLMGVAARVGEFSTSGLEQLVFSRFAPAGVLAVNPTGKPPALMHHW